MATDVLNYIQSKFYIEFPRDPREDVYNFRTCSTLKPTQISCTEGSLNQIPPVCTIQGDIRLAPFYDISQARIAMERWIAEINADPQGTLGGLSNRGPHSKYAVEDENIVGKVKLTVFDGENGIAVNLGSPGYEALLAATKHILKEVKPYSIGGSLPLVREMQDHGFDLQIAGNNIYFLD